MNSKIQMIYTIIGSITSKGEERNFTLTHKQGGIDYSIRINLEYNNVTIEFEKNISEELLIELKKDIKLISSKPWSQEMDFPEKLIEELLNLTKDAEFIVKKMMYYLKYGYNQRDLDFKLIQFFSAKISENQREWYNIPQRFKVIVKYHRKMSLSQENVFLLEQYLRDEIPQLYLAYTFLEMAEQDISPETKWIAISTAAELAIKECLMRIEPKLKDLMEELPSPPINKLYGSILMAYCGQKSKYLKDLQEGSERRNKLIHKPKFIEINEQEISEYAQIVRYTIDELEVIESKIKENKSMK